MNVRFQCRNLRWVSRLTGLSMWNGMGSFLDCMEIRVLLLLSTAGGDSSLLPLHYKPRQVISHNSSPNLTFTGLRHPVSHVQFLEIVLHVQRGFPVLLSPYLFACNIRFGCLSPLILSTCLAYLKWSNFEMAKCTVPRITHSARDYNCSITLRFQTRSRRWCDMYLPLPNTKTLEVTHDKMKLIGKSIIFAWKSLIGRRVDNSSWFQLEKSH